MSATLLIEILTEELPPKSLAKLGTVFLEQMHKSLSEAGFIKADNAGHWYATPRRLAVCFAETLATQPDRTIERKGPAVASGVNAAGEPTAALEGFLRSAGVSLAQLERQRDGKAEYFVARIAKSGEALEQHLSKLVDAALKKLPVAKIMRWGAGEAQFVRPVHGLVMLHGERVVPGRVLDIDSGRSTRGHRFMSSGRIELATAEAYEATLEQACVIADFAKRRALIRAQLDTAAGSRVWLQDEALVDEVTALVESPTVYEAGFEAEFLQVPQECLILTMKANQKYFPLFEAGKLSNRFLLVSNMRVADPVNIVGGNARVVRPRLADAKFFFTTDCKKPLASRLDKLERVVYHNKLGSQGQRVRRLVRLAEYIAAVLGADVAQAGRAALLAKADLVTDMVGEFPELQGIMGRYYALHDGEAAVVADAVQAHYLPRFMGDALPTGKVACAVALADRVDALVGFFGIGQVPTGDKDPFGLRRAALGVLRLLMETPLPLDLAELIGAAAAGFAPGQLAGDYALALREFMFERLRGLLREGGAEANSIEAVLALRPTRIDLLPVKLAAVRSLQKLPEAQALAAANKRIINILKKADSVPTEVDATLLQEPAEKALFAQLTALTPRLRALVAGEDYEAALLALAGLRDAVDGFFDDVMVMAEETALRQNRLALLSQLAALMNQVADISKL